jgi:hypothetical protein
MATWQPKLAPEEKKYLECVVINKPDLPLTKEEGAQHITALNNMLLNKWNRSRFSCALCSIRKELGAKVVRGGAIPRKKKAEKVPGDYSEKELIFTQVFKILDCSQRKIKKLIEKDRKFNREEIKRLRGELKEKTDKLRDLTAIRQSVENYQKKFV